MPSYLFFDKLSIGDNTNIGIIQDETETQYQINGNWYHKSIVKPSKNLKNEPLKNRGYIDTNMVIGAYQNDIDVNKLNKYIDVMKNELLSNNFPPIKGYPIIISETDIERYGEYLNGEEIQKSDIGKYAWILTDGFHRTLSALEVGLERIPTEIDYSYVNDEDL